MSIRYPDTVSNCYEVKLGSQVGRSSWKVKLEIQVINTCQKVRLGSHGGKSKLESQVGKSR